jgi:DNA polymerase III delta subunit
MPDQVRVCWLSGSYFQRKALLENLLTQLGEHELWVYENDATPEYISQQIMGAGLFCNSRAIILKSLPDFEGSQSNKKWSELLSQVPSDCLVIIDDVAPSSHPKIYSHVKKVGKVFEFPQYLPRPECLSWVSDRLVEAGKTTDKECIEQLVDSFGEVADKGFDTDRLFVYIKKLISYLGSHKEVTKADVLQTVDATASVVVWSIFEAIDHRDYFSCISMLHRLVKNSKNEDEAINYLFSMLQWRYKALLILKELKNQKLSDNEILDRVMSIGKIKRSGTGSQTILEQDLDKNGQLKSIYSRPMLQNTLNGAYGKTSPLEYYSRVELFKMLKCVQECMQKIRLDYGCNVMSIADNFFMSVCNQADSDLLASNRRLTSEE